MVCNKPLKYHENSIELKCLYCGNIEYGHILCPEGHYVCEECHNQEIMKIIESVVFTTMADNPFEIAEFIMTSPALPMLGCHHAYIAGGAIMAAIKNRGSKKITNEEIKEVFRRTKRQAHGGYCGLTGVCGIVPAVGACFSVLTGSKCGTDREQRITMEAVTKVTQAIKELTGPSCCKAYMRASLEIAIDCLKDSLGIELPKSSKPVCSHSSEHPHYCRQNRCPYFH
jgi:hypothetical protein